MLLVEYYDEVMDKTATPTWGKIHRGFASRAIQRLGSIREGTDSAIGGPLSKKLIEHYGTHAQEVAKRMARRGNENPILKRKFMKQYNWNGPSKATPRVREWLSKVIKDAYPG